MKSKPTFNRFFTAVGEVLDAAVQASEDARLARIEEEKEKQTLVDQINEWNAKHPLNPITLATTERSISPERPSRCSPFRLVEDCENKDCVIHYDEKKRIRDAKARTQSL